MKTLSKKDQHNITPDQALICYIKEINGLFKTYDLIAIYSTG